MTSLARISWRHIGLLLAIPLTLIVLGQILHNSAVFSEITRHVQGHRVPDVLFKSGRTVKELRLLESHPGRKFRSARFSSHQPGEMLPSAAAVGSVVAGNDTAILSIVIDHDDLHHPRTGLMTNFLNEGRRWERPAYVSYFDKGELLFSGGAGVRVHGGTSRNMQSKSLRLYFRDMYGQDRFPDGTLFDGHGDPIRSIVVHNDIRRMHMDEDSNMASHFTNPLAFDIARQVGSIAPLTKPVQLYLNGQYEGPYVLIEHISINYLRAHFGDGDFTYGRGKAKPEPIRTVTVGDPDALHELYAEFTTAPAPLTLDYVRQRVDVENMTSWFIGILLTGVTDAFQGAIVHNALSADGLWFWVNWDMDHAFRDVYALAPPGRPWENNFFDGPQSITRDSRLRGVLLSRLRHESPEYGLYFLRRFTDAINHQVTAAFVSERIGYYERTAMAFGIEDLSYLDAVRTYLDNRPSALLQQVSEYFAVEPANRLRIDNPAGLDISVDGYRLAGPFTGWYYAETPALIRVAGSQESDALVWMLNGTRIEPADGTLELILESDSVLEISRAAL